MSWVMQNLFFESDSRCLEKPKPSQTCLNSSTTPKEVICWNLASSKHLKGSSTKMGWPPHLHVHWKVDPPSKEQSGLLRRLLHPPSTITMRTASAVCSLLLIYMKAARIPRPAIHDVHTTNINNLLNCAASCTWTSSLVCIY